MGLERFVQVIGHSLAELLARALEPLLCRVRRDVQLRRHVPRVSAVEVVEDKDFARGFIQVLNLAPEEFEEFFTLMLRILGRLSVKEMLLARIVPGIA